MFYGVESMNSMHWSCPWIRSMLLPRAYVSGSVMLKLELMGNAVMLMMALLKIALGCRNNSIPVVVVLHLAEQLRFTCPQHTPLHALWGWETC